jgi:hypothetical protein
MDESRMCPVCGAPMRAVPGVTLLRVDGHRISREPRWRCPTTACQATPPVEAAPEAVSVA